MASDRHLLRYHYGGRLPSLQPADIPLADTAGLPIRSVVDPIEFIKTSVGNVYDQLQLGSCTANADSKSIDIDRVLDGNSSVSPARLPIYRGERLLEGSPLHQDTGAIGHDGFKYTGEFGFWSESEIPYSDQLSDPDFYQDPITAHGVAPYKFTKKVRSVPRSLLHFKQVLSNQQTISFGFPVYESFETAQVASTGIMPIPNPHTERLLGGHQVLGVGYLVDHPEYMLCANSWGPNWGHMGFFFFPWALLMTPRYASDFRTIVREPIS